MPNYVRTFSIWNPMIEMNDERENGVQIASWYIHGHVRKLTKSPSPHTHISVKYLTLSVTCLTLGTISD